MKSFKEIITLISVFIIMILLIGCSGVKTDYTDKMVIIDANLLGVDLQTGFDPATGTPLPKLQMGEIDATYITIPIDCEAKNSQIEIVNRTNSIWGTKDYLQRKITVKTSINVIEIEKEITEEGD